MPQLPIAVGTKLVLIFGAMPLTHSASARVRMSSELSSMGRNTSTTQVGVVAAKKSWLLAVETQDSTLQAPGSLTSAVSTT
ncbi:MAG: hypothetical protein WCB62_26355 [Pseudolabrys sp.]